MNNQFRVSVYWFVLVLCMVGWAVNTSAASQVFSNEFNFILFCLSFMMVRDALKAVRTTFSGKARLVITLSPFLSVGPILGML
ncbi:hypothetical protein A6E01_20640 (plasmid) [Vibrio breoganii]|uniref:Uncharacterized protein n=1 Tax=Vibrio breoganii TaxID=553239 RepID=A0A193KJL5_9VIBR|nr:hypothetical protein A6E01_20640 [Vibrio breoganii]